MAGGRPTKYTPAMCDRVVALFKEGCSKAEICLDLDISFSTWNNWEKDNPEFLEAVKKGVDLSRGWWEKQGRVGLYTSREGDNLNPTTWFMNMKNRFKEDWRDKQEHDHSTLGEKITPTTFIIGGAPQKDEQ